MIYIKNITKTYNKETVLEIDYLEIKPGQTFGLVGNNGAGKTTLFSTILDLIKPTTGEVLNNKINVRKSEDWKSFTSAFLDESFLILSKTSLIMISGVTFPISKELRNELRVNWSSNVN